MRRGPDTPRSRTTWGRTAAATTAAALAVSAWAVQPEPTAEPETPAADGASAPGLHARSPTASMSLDRRSAGMPPTALVHATEGAPPPQESFNVPYDGLFHFVRIRFESGRRGFFGRGRGALWAHDYPRAERNFLSILDETTYVRAQTEGSNVLRFDDPELFSYPVAYIVEIGGWNPSDEEVGNLGAYLLKGGFLIVDDFQGGRALDNLRFHLRRALPEHTMMEVPDDHAVFDSFFRITPQNVIPPYGPRNPMWFGIFEDNDPQGRLMVVINANNDIAEYWEYSDYGYYPIDLSNEAYKLGVNYVVYGLTR